MKRIVFEGTEEQFKNLEFLMEQGKNLPKQMLHFQTDNLWSTQDVTDKYCCDDDTAMGILEIVLNSGSLMERINEDIADQTEEDGLQEHIDQKNPQPMRKFEIVFFDGYDEVREVESGKAVFRTEGMNVAVVEKVVHIWNEKGVAVGNIFSDGKLDDYLMDEGRCSTEQKEIIVESLCKHSFYYKSLK